MKKNIKKSSAKTSLPAYDRWFAILALIFMCVFPFIAHLTVLRIPENEQLIFTSTNGLIVDIALFSKEIAIAVFAGLALLFFAGEFIFPDKPRRLDRARISELRIPLFCILLMTVLELLSFFLSKNRMTALLGVNSEYEGLIALLSYTIVFFIGLVYFKAPFAKEYLLRAAVILSLVTGLLSFIEIAWKPILEFTFFQHLISAEENYYIAESIKNLYFAGQSSLLFNNPGFLGSFLALLLPIDLAIVLDCSPVFFSDSKAAKKKTSSKEKATGIGAHFEGSSTSIPDTILKLASIAFLSVAMYGSDSKAAWVSLIVSLPAVVIFAIKKSPQKKALAIKLIVSILLSAALILAAVTGSRKSMDSLQEQAGTSTDSLVFQAESSPSKLFKLDRAELLDGELFFTSGEDTLHLILDVSKLDEYEMTGAAPTDYVDCITITDGAGNVLERVPSSIDNERLDFHIDGIRPADERFEAVTIATDERMLYVHFGYEGTAQFAMLNGFRAFAQGTEMTDYITQPAITGFERFYGFATGRGYIWVQSLPILAKCLLLGKGCGNFPFLFRQNEIVGLLNTHGSCKYVIDRPHNMYLQYAISNGVPALILMLILFIWCLIKAFRSRNVGLFAGLLGFMIAALINDSCITVAPVFWFVLGIAVARSKPITPC